MFFRYFTLFLLFSINVTYSLKLKNKSVFKTNYNFIESKNCVNTPKLGTHCLFFINRPSYFYNRLYSHQKYNNKVNLKEDKFENENLYTTESTESRTENTVQDSTNKTDTNHITHNTLDEYNNINEKNKNEINELVNAALKWETIKIPDPQPDLTYEEMASMKEKFLRSMDDNERTFGQIVRRAIQEKEAEVTKSAKEKEQKEDWKEVLEEFTIDVEGKKCYGCGANLQCRDEIKRGYVEPEHYEQFNKLNLIKCKRCSSLGSGTYFLPSNNNNKHSTTNTSKKSKLPNRSDLTNSSNLSNLLNLSNTSNSFTPTYLSNISNSSISSLSSNFSSSFSTPSTLAIPDIDTDDSLELDDTYSLEEMNPNSFTNDVKHDYIRVSEREEILPEELLDNKKNQSNLRKLQQKQILDKQISEKQLFRKEDEIMKKIKEASTETVNIVRNMLKIKKRKRITILYIVDVIDPHIEIGLLELIKKRQEQYEQMIKDHQEEDEEEIDIEELKSKKDIKKKYKDNKDNKEENRNDGGIKLYLILNKIDLLPKYDKNEIIQYFRKMINTKVDVQLKSKNVFLISSKYHVNINLLLSVILLEAKKLQNQILFIGPTNSGKSTLINAIHHILKISNNKKISRKQQDNSSNNNNNSIDNNNTNSNISDSVNQDKNYSNIETSTENNMGEVNETEKERDKENKEISLGKKVTSSIVPGTTLGVLGIKLGMGLKIYDTPGIFMPNSLLSYLDHYNLKNVIINTIQPNKAIRLSKGHTLLIDKFVRVDVTHGRDFFVKFYMSDKLGIFVKKSHKLEEFISKHFGDQYLYYPSNYIGQEQYEQMIKDNQKEDGEVDYNEKYMVKNKDNREKAEKEKEDNRENMDNNRNIDNKYDNQNKKNKDNNNYKDIHNKEINENYQNNNNNYINRKFEIILEGWNNATCDLCIKGLGFMTIGGALKINFNLFTRKDVELYLRKPMFPRNIFPFKPRKN